MFLISVHLKLVCWPLYQKDMLGNGCLFATKVSINRRLRHARVEGRARTLARARKTGR